MTRISGTQIIETPCCRAQYSTPAYGSINLTAHEYWTDGRRVGSLFGGGGGLRRCVCGQYFLLHMCDHIRTIPKSTYKPRAPKGWQNTKSNWWSRLWGKPTLGDYLLNYDIRTDEEVRSGSTKLNRPDKCIIGVFRRGKGAGAGDLYEQIIWAANPPRV